MFADLDTWYFSFPWWVRIPSAVGVVVLVFVFFDTYHPQGGRKV